MRTLEADLGYPLFERLNRAVAPTEDGACYAARVTAAFEGLIVRPATRSRARVVIDVDADLLRLWLLPRLTPDVLGALDIDAIFRARADRPRILPADTDVAIVWGTLDYEGFAARTLLRSRVFAVAAPSLGLGTLADVARARLLHDRDAGWWRALHEVAGLPYLEDAASLTFDRCDLPIEAARLGLGVAVGDDVIAEAYLRAGLLVRLDGASLETRAYHLLIRRRRKSGAAKRLAEWIAAEAETFARKQAET